MKLCKKCDLIIDDISTYTAMRTAISETISDFGIIFTEHQLDNLMYLIRSKLFEEAK